MAADPSAELPELLRRARNGDEQALGQALEEHRAYLRLLALRTLDTSLGARLDASDVVQQTCLSAIRDFSQFTGNEPAEFAAWLARIHERNLQDAVREHRVAQRRSVKSEQPLDEAAAIIDARADSPSRPLLAAERLVALARLLETLPEDQREAVRLRHLEGRSLAEIATRLQRSERAVAALLNRGLESLRKRSGKMDL